MSYARFGWDNSDVYVFEHVAGYIQCCGCILPEYGDEDWIGGFYNAPTANDMLKHLDEHRAAGNVVPERTYTDIREEYKDLDANILPFREQQRLGKVTE